jgi:hypothetical protein
MTNEQVKLIPRELRELIELNFPTARFLSEEEQAKYEEACKQFSGKAADNLRIGINGSNLFKVLLLNQIGIRTTTLPELESALENGLALQGFYEDVPSIILRSAGDSYSQNDYLARSLAKFLGITEFKVPLIVNGLEVVADDKSQYGLGFKRTDKTQVIEAPSLSHGNNQKRFFRISQDYSVKFDEKGSRTLYTRDNGISRLCLYRGSDLDSRIEDLACSNDYGRVVVVGSGEASAKNFENYLSQLNSERQAQIAEVEKRYANAMRVLKGN